MFLMKLWRSKDKFIDSVLKFVTSIFSRGFRESVKLKGEEINARCHYKDPTKKDKTTHVLGSMIGCLKFINWKSKTGLPWENMRWRIEIVLVDGFRDLKKKKKKNSVWRLMIRTSDLLFAVGCPSAAQRNVIGAVRPCDKCPWWSSHYRLTISTP